MTKLSSLRISNIRRFGSDVTFDFSPTANIILAPNGTGKTSVFEAIELALSGSIARLDGDLRPAIRETVRAAAARVTFGKMTRTARLTQDSKIAIQEGQKLSELLGLKDELNADLPYLLRLTHLLDQRDREWFVQADPKAAGFQLARLPLTRDSAVAYATTTGARRYARDRYTTNLSNSKAAAERLQTWEQLLADRDQAAESLVRELRSATSVAEVLVPIAHEVLGSAVVIQTISTPHLITLSTHLSSRVDNEIARINGALATIRAAAPLIDQFGAAYERVKRFGADKSTSTEALTSVRAELERLNARYESQRILEAALVGRRADTSSQLSKIERLKASAADLDEYQSRLRQLSDELVTLETSLSAVRAERQKLLDLKQLNDTLEARFIAAQAREASVRAVDSQITRWTEIEEQITRARSESASDESELLRLRDQREALAQAESTAEQSALDSKRQLDELITSTNAIRSAVLTIATELPASTEDCPVCGTHYGAEELHRRLRSALDAASPLLASAEDQYRKTLAILDSSRRKRDATDGLIQEIDQRIARREREFDRWNLQLSAIKASVDIRGENPTLARANLQAQIATLVNARELAQASLLESSQQGSDVAKLSDAEVKAEALNRALEALRKERGTLEQKLQTALAVHAELETTCRDIAPIEQLRASFAEIDTKIATASRLREETTAMQENQSAAVLVAEESLLGIESKLAEANREVVRIQDQWTAAGLLGDPSSTTISVATTQHELGLEKLQKFQTTIRAADNDLDRLRIAEDSHRAQEEIDRIRQDRPETVVTENLRADATKASNEAARAQDVLMALDTLSTTLSVQISDIHERVMRGIPTWQALLKRIVRDQRFSNATLEFFSRYNKEHAGMKVPLGTNQVAVPAVASEAQLTDVQLSFLLSLALGQTWSQWKGLLLDDPTQHHDLVHAAAVFDVLRDFVVEQDFQLILATHDALQARYLMRKMENDGIDVRLWTLVPAEGGVKAIPSP